MSKYMAESKRSKTVYIKDDETLTDSIRRELNDKLSRRYKIVHMAEDVGVDKFQMYRFMHGQEVTGKFYDKVFKFLMK
jgi:hypothetical protein